MQAGSDVTMDDAGVRETSEYGSAVVRWEDVFKVMESDSAYYVFFSRMQAFLIPKQLVAPEEDATLRALIRQHVQPEKNKLSKARLSASPMCCRAESSRRLPPALTTFGFIIMIE